MRIYISFDTDDVLKTIGELRRDIVVFGRQFLIDAMQEEPASLKEYDDFDFINRLSVALASGWTEFLEAVQHKLWLLDEKTLDSGDSLDWCVKEFTPIFEGTPPTMRRNVLALNCPVYDIMVMELLTERAEAGYRDMLNTLTAELEQVFEKAWQLFKK
ncbi:hypothetical protein WELLINGTON_240 [Erwinia phage Wellington]|uniref:Uncharacterized protein n=1 Tax=Erwinia phage Wellington TaxID=2267653 RepID=A0A345BLP5_9CAUD|nr:hypothetical protein HOT70_gp061 [Erwinia phage Wellington]AXF51366.1 hypothetical protein WELLINGTON_240 [Erwinia phage Wellington]